jgi:hypothetical protein
VSPKYKAVSLKDGNTYPFDILADPVIREPILKIIGKNYFSKFRQSIGVASPVKTIDDTFIVGAGCQPHSCDSPFAMFIIDIVNKLGWAVEGSANVDGERRNARLWGALTPSDAVPLREIRRWLERAR